MPHGLLTVGHGTLSVRELGAVFTDAGVESVVDVRRFPGSRRHPHVMRAELAGWLPDLGIEYRWREVLGGRRRPRPDSPHVAIRNDSFRAYADWMAEDAWSEAMGDVADLARHRVVAVMCSESVWWRCHRRFIAEAAVRLHGLQTCHLMHDGSCHDHEPMDEGRIVAGRLIYDQLAD